jgi:hypothetical protein
MTRATPSRRTMTGRGGKMQNASLFPRSKMHAIKQSRVGSDRRRALLKDAERAGPRGCGPAARSSRPDERLRRPVGEEGGFRRFCQAAPRLPPIISVMSKARKSRRDESCRSQNGHLRTSCKSGTSCRRFPLTESLHRTLEKEFRTRTAISLPPPTSNGDGASLAVRSQCR